MLTKNRLGILAFALLTGLAYGLVGQTSVPPLSRSGEWPYLATNSTSDSFTSMAARTTTAPTTIISMGATPGETYRTLRFVPYGTGAVGSTFAFKVWAIDRGAFGPSDSIPRDYVRRLYCSGTATLGSQTGVLTTGGITTSDKIADSVTLTTEAYGGKAYAAFGGIAPSALSPATTSGEVVIWISDSGNSDFEIETDLTGATSANYLVSRHR